LAEHFSKENMLKRIVQTTGKVGRIFCSNSYHPTRCPVSIARRGGCAIFQRYLENLIASQLGLSVTIGDISGSYVSELVVTNVTTPETGLCWTMGRFGTKAVARDLQSFLAF
jgi:hypothetical protein